MTVKRARLYDAIVALIVISIIALDQWTKTLALDHLSLGIYEPFPGIGHYLGLELVRNSGAAFSMFTNNVFLVVLILAAVLVVVYLYARMLNSGPLFFKIVFGLIIGGAAGNLLDRAFRGGSVVDFVSFRIPEISFQFAIFNIADACISVGVILLFVLLIFGGGFNRTADEEKKEAEPAPSGNPVPTQKP